MLAAGVPDGRPAATDRRAGAPPRRRRVRGTADPPEETAEARRRPPAPATRAPDDRVPRADELASARRRRRASSTTTSTAATSWSARPATGSSTGATPWSPTRSRRSTSTFNSIAHKTGRRARRSGVRSAARRLPRGLDRRGAAPGPRCEPPRSRGTSRCIGNARSPWERAVIGLEAGEMDGFDDSVAGWLVELADRLDGPAWASSALLDDEVRRQVRPAPGRPASGRPSCRPGSSRPPGCGTSCGWPG